MAWHLKLLSLFESKKLEKTVARDLKRWNVIDIKVENGRNYTKDYSRFLQIARGSLYEMQTQIEISKNINFISEKDVNEIFDLTLEVEKMLNSLINKLKV